MGSIPESPEQLLELFKAAVREKAPSHRFRLDNGQLARLSIESEEGGYYPNAVVALDVPKAEQAIVAALVALKGTQVEKEELYRVHDALASAHWAEQSLESAAKDKPRPEKPSGMKKTTTKDVKQGYKYRYAEDLLRHYRPEFGDMAQMDQAALVTRVLEKTNNFLDALRELALCVQHAHPYEGLPNTPVKKATRDVLAAQLRDVEGLSYREIGEQLDVPQSQNDVIRGDNYRVRTQLVPQGRAILTRALTEAGYKEFVESSKAEMKRRRSLTEPEREIEDWAGLAKIPVETMRRIVAGTEEDFAAAVGELRNKEQLIVAWMARSARETFPHSFPH